MSGSPAGIIYKVTNTTNGKVYVGQTVKSVGRRWSQHCSAAKKGSTYAIHAAIRKYGKGVFKTEILVAVEGSFQDLLDAEILWIAKLGCKYPAGYNLTDGGEGLDWTDPILLARHAEAVRRSSQTESWKAAQIEGAQKRVSNPNWRAKNLELLKSMHSDPLWLERNARHLQEMREDPSHKRRFAASMVARSESDWAANHKEAMVALHTDPAYSSQRDANFKAANAKKSRDALLRDAQCSPEEAARRRRRRETARARYARKNVWEAQHGT